MSTREAVIRDGRIVGYVHQEQTAGHQLSALRSRRRPDVAFVTARA